MVFSYIFDGKKLRAQLLARFPNPVQTAMIQVSEYEVKAELCVNGIGTIRVRKCEGRLRNADRKSKRRTWNQFRESKFLIILHRTNQSRRKCPNKTSEIFDSRTF